MLLNKSFLHPNCFLAVSRRTSLRLAVLLICHLLYTCSGFSNSSSQFPRQMAVNQELNLSKFLRASWTTCCCEFTSSEMANWLIDLQFSHPTLSKWIFSLSQFTFPLQTDTFARPLGPVYQHWVGMAEGSLWLFGTTWHSLISQTLAKTQSLSSCCSSGGCAGASALKSLVFLPGLRAKEFLHHQLRSASHAETALI